MSIVQLSGKTAVVTGSTSGIGLGILRSFAAAGANVVMNGLGDAAEIEKLRTDIEKETGTRVLYHAADMTKPEQIRDMIAKAADTFGSVDILVNNAGIQHVQPVYEFDDVKWSQIIAINMESAFHATKAASNHMRAKQWGRIINIASVHGLVASKFKSAYITAKHGVVGLTRASALDLAEFGVTVNAICPGYVDTPLVRKQIPAQAKEHNMSEVDVIDKVMLKNHAVKEFVAVEDLAAFALFLCSDHARTMTGQAIAMDGGWTAQ